jgi:hypothetical protein
MSSENVSFIAGGGDMGEHIRRFDWAANRLGPPANWPQSLKTAVRIMLTSRQPIWIGWGQQLLYLYNDPYKSIIGGKHPWALGDRPKKCGVKFGLRSAPCWRPQWVATKGLTSKLNC